MKRGNEKGRERRGGVASPALPLHPSHYILHFVAKKWRQNSNHYN